MVVHPQVHGAVGLRTARGLRGHHHERGRLASAQVAPLALGGFERDDEPLREPAVRGREGIHHRVPDGAGGHDVRLRAHAVADVVTRVPDAALPGVSRHATPGVHHRDLAHLRALGAVEESRQHLARALPARSNSRPRGPKAGSTTACVATQPTPASAQGTSEPTARKCDWTATPSSPVEASRATME